MNFLLLIPNYLGWHYRRGIISFFEIWKNILWFLWNFFSIKILMKTFFDPFERLDEKYSGGLSVENFFSTLLLNLIMRFLGMFIRFSVILIGLLACLSFIFLGLIGFIIWILLPLILPWLLITSLIALIK